MVVGIEPTTRFMNRCGMGTSTREVALQRWEQGIPKGDPAELVRELYHVENDGQLEPSGSQDMAGLVYPGVSRLDYDFEHEGGYFPVHVETNTDPEILQWVENIIYMVPINQRPPGYNPLEEKNIDPVWVQRLGKSGADCFDAIVGRDVPALGASMNECMLCWKTLLPNTVRHATIKIDLVGILEHYQQKYAGAMYSGCGGGYVYVASDEPVPGGFQVKVRAA